MALHRSSIALNSPRTVSTINVNGTYAFMAGPWLVRAARILAATNKLAVHGGKVFL
jgi:hypothetical protein